MISEKTIQYSKPAYKYLKKFRDPKLKDRVLGKIKLLSRDPFPPDCKQLKEESFYDSPAYRIRSGDYRIVYVVVGDKVFVIDVDHRSSVYKHVGESVIEALDEEAREAAEDAADEAALKEMAKDPDFLQHCPELWNP